MKEQKMETLYRKVEIKSAEEILEYHLTKDILIDKTPHDSIIDAMEEYASQVTSQRQVTDLREELIKFTEYMNIDYAYASEDIVNDYFKSKQ